MHSKVIVGLGKRPLRCWAAACFQLALADGLLALMGCGSRPHLEPIRLDAAPDSYRSVRWTVQSTVQIERASAGLRCVVEGNRQTTKGPYGGFMFPTSDAKGWRLEMAFTEPDAVLMAYVDAYNAKGARLLRWQTDEKAKLRRNRMTYVFTPHQSAEGFKPVASEGSGPIATIHVFARIKPGSRASFELHKVELIQ
jgi:hypothetical protein